MKVCEHDGQLIPMLSTMVFAGAEYWCPHCGTLEGIFDSPHVEASPELVALQAKYVIASQKYLKARSIFSCSSLLYDGERVTPDQLPDHSREQQRKIIDAFQYPVAVK